MDGASACNDRTSRPERRRASRTCTPECAATRGFRQGFATCPASTHSVAGCFGLGSHETQDLSGIWARSPSRRQLLRPRAVPPARHLEAAVVASPARASDERAKHPRHFAAGVREMDTTSHRRCSEAATVAAALARLAPSTCLDVRLHQCQWLSGRPSRPVTCHDPCLSDSTFYAGKRLRPPRQPRLSSAGAIPGTFLMCPTRAFLPPAS